MAERFRKRFREKTAPRYDQEDYKKKLDPYRQESSQEKKKIKNLATLYYKEVLRPDLAFGSKISLYSNTTSRNIIIVTVILVGVLLGLSSYCYNFLFYRNIDRLGDTARRKLAVIMVVTVTMFVTIIVNYLIILRFSAKWLNIFLFLFASGFFFYVWNELRTDNTYLDNQPAPDSQLPLDYLLSGGILSLLAALGFAGLAFQGNPEDDVVNLILEKNEREKTENLMKKIREHQDEAVRDQKEKWEQARLNEDQKRSVFDEAFKLYLEKNKKAKQAKQDAAAAAVAAASSVNDGGATGGNAS